jgi:hypothetical protein
MSYYRIQIDELQNGEKRYVPQKGELHISRSWIQRQEIRWRSIGNARYISESEAMKIIESEKEYEGIKKGLEIKSITYKIID